MRARATCHRGDRRRRGPDMAAPLNQGRAVRDLCGRFRGRIRALCRKSQFVPELPSPFKSFSFTITFFVIAPVISVLLSRLPAFQVSSPMHR